MGYFEDLYSKKEQEKEDRQKIQEQQDIKLMLQKYNDEIIFINRLIKAIIDKISYEPPDSCDWIFENINESEKKVVAWRIYNRFDGSGYRYYIYLLPNGKLTSTRDGRGECASADDAKYLKHIDYVEGLTLEKWREIIPFYYGIISIPWSVDEKDSLRERFVISAKSIFGVEIDKD